MWLYKQSTGELSHDGELVGVGYAGNGEGKNNAAMQNVHGIGPLPVGFYTIDKAYNHPHLGPITMNLIPDATNEMFGRGDFRIHGDSIDAPGTASEGCIVQSRPVRTKVNTSIDRRLQVVA